MKTWSYVFQNASLIFNILIFKYIRILAILSAKFIAVMTAFGKDYFTIAVDVLKGAKCPQKDM